MKRKLSKLVKSPYDSRDYVLSAAVSGLPSSASLKPWIGGIEDQGNLNSCVGNSTVSALEILLARDNQFRDLSRLFEYWTTRSLSNMDGSDGGAYLRDAFKAANKFGICNEATYPYDPSKVNYKPTDAAFAEAQNFKVLRYEFCGSYHVNSVKTAIARGFPVIIAAFVTNEIFSVSGPIATQHYKGSSADHIIGSHAMCVIAYDDTIGGFIVENSWGTGWGDNGCFLLPYTVAEKDVFDSWAATALTGVNVAPMWVQPEPGTRVFLDPNDNFIINGPCKVYGNAPCGIVLNPQALRVVADANVSKVAIPYSDFEKLRFLQTGNVLNVYKDEFLLCKWAINSYDYRLDSKNRSGVAVKFSPQRVIEVDGKPVSSVVPSSL